MRCRDVDRLAAAYLEGGLDDGRSSALRGHLRLCESCRDRVEDEAALVEAAARVELCAPPAELWTAIEERLGEEEIADARRPRLWLWWQGARPYAAGVALAGATAALLVWSRLDGGDSEPAPRPEHVLQESPRSHAEAVELEVTRADRRYQEIIGDLRAIVAEERASWPADTASAFDVKLAELEAQVVRERTRIAAAPPDPAARDPLYAAYRAQIGLLEAAVFGAPAAAEPR